MTSVIRLLVVKEMNKMYLRENELLVVRGKNEAMQTDIPSYLWKQQTFQGQHKGTTQKHSLENVEVTITFCRLLPTLSTLEEYLEEESSSFRGVQCTFLTNGTLYELGDEGFVCRLSLHVHRTRSLFIWSRLVIERKFSISEIDNIFKVS